MSKKVYVIVTTKNRSKLLKNALNSIINQKFMMKEIIVVTDSNNLEKSKEENHISELKIKITYINNKRSKCYSGSLNTAIDYLISENKIIELLDSYIAILDDDDTWGISYLDDCVKNLDKDYDFLIPGINLLRNNKTIKLSIPNKLNHNSFLAKNPHIQGSNTFIKFSTILKAGCFDENIHSTTDREFFTRVMLLNPTYKNLNIHNVYFNCEENRDRISNNKRKKIDGLSNFYYKNKGLIDAETKEGFVENIKKFNINLEDLNENLKKQRLLETSPKDILNNKSKNFKLTIGIIATYELVDNLIKDINNLSKDKNIEVIVIDNFKTVKISNKFNEYFNKFPFVKFIKKEELKKNASNLVYGDEIKCNLNINRNYIKDIAIARTILFYHMYKVESDVYWVLDDDMRLSFLDLIGNNYQENKLDIFKYLENIDFKKNDALIGKYTKDSPIPMLYSLRSQLIDYFYNNYNQDNKFNFLNKNVLLSSDFYHDLSKYNIYNETPVYSTLKKSIENIFSGIQEYRKLHKKIPCTNSNTSCGGNVLIFNKELLKVENQSIIINGLYGRRGDSLWRILATKGYGYSIENGDFSTLHSRGVTKFDLLVEIKKVKKDIIGHAFVNAFNDYTIGQTNKEEITKVYFQYLESRVNHFIKQFYRIIGIIKSINYHIEEIEYLKQFENFDIRDFISYFDVIKKNEVEYELKKMISKFEQVKKCLSENTYKKFLVNNFNVRENKLKLLGRGNEGIVFTDNENVYKIFYDKIDLLKYFNINSINSKHFYDIELFNKEFDVIRYKYEYSKPYSGGENTNMISLLKEMHEYKFIYANLTKSNLIIVDNILKVVDYGESFLEYNEDTFEKTMKKAYLLARYPNLSEREYKKITSKIIKGTGDILLTGFDEFRLAILNRHHVSIHDTPIINYVKNKKWVNLLDYGAGKCQNSNKLKLMFPSRNIYAFDILYEQVKERAKDIEVIKEIETFSQSEIDYTLCNIVLSTVNFDICDMILSNINKISKVRANVLVSITNPFFTNNESTEIKLSTEKINLYKNTKLTKRVRSTSRYRSDYYKTIDTYKYLFRRNGFKIVNTFESNGVNFETLIPNSDFLYFELEKFSDILLFEDVSLLIKTNPIEYETIRKQVESLVTSIEIGCKFKEKSLLIDDFNNIPNRQYREKNRDVFYDELDILLNNRYIDKLIKPLDNPNQIKNIYKKYFDLENTKPHSANGQQLFTTLYGFEKIVTNKVLQIDSDIILRVEKRRWLEKAIKKLEEKDILTISLNIANASENKEFYGEVNRVEVRASLLDLEKLNKNLPLENTTINKVLLLPWHKTLDTLVKNSNLKSLRSIDNSFYFIHPENQIKYCSDLYNKLIDYNMALYPLPFCQYNNVNVVNDKSIWKRESNDDVVIFSRGRNTNMGKLKRFFDSLEKQTFKNFRLIYIDDYSNNYTEQYAKFRCEYFKQNKKPIYIRNYVNKKMIKNLFMGMELIKNENAIVIHIDNDDSLIDENAIEIILEKYKKGHDVTFGNCLRVDKPTKFYQYEVKDVKSLHYTNYWVHPKSHLKILFNEVLFDDFTFKGNTYEVNSDIIMMKKIIEKSKNPIFIKEKLYLFEPSIENLKETNEYNQELKEDIKNSIVKE